VWVSVCRNVVSDIVLAVMHFYVIYKSLSLTGDQQQDLGKQASNSQTNPIYGKLLGVLPHVVSEKTKSALRKEQGWTHSLSCCQSLAAHVCMI
jgi:hypothetical protein